jgi:hypothetical protein
MAGWTTNGVEQIKPLVVNGVVTTVESLTNNGTVVVATTAAPPATSLPFAALTSFDIQSTAGAQPITVAASTFAVSAQASALITNQATSTVHAATLNTVQGMITTEALTTAINATYTFTLTNSLITATGPAPQVVLHWGTNTAGVVQVNSVTNAAGSAVFVFQNVGTAAFNGTFLLCFHT